MRNRSRPAYPVQTAYINILPDELLIKVFFLVCDEISAPDPPRRAAIRQKRGARGLNAVCRRWRHICWTTLSLMVLDLPFESSRSSLHTCRELILRHDPVDMDISINLTSTRSAHFEESAEMLVQVLAAIIPHCGRWRALTIVARATAFMSQALKTLETATSAPKLRVFRFEAVNGSQAIPMLPVPGIRDPVRPSALTHLSISGGQLIVSQGFHFPHALELEIMDRAGERGLTLQWRDVASILRATPSLKALRLDCNINYESTNSCTLEVPSPPQIGSNNCPPFLGRPSRGVSRPSGLCRHSQCMTARSPVVLSELREMYLDRYDFTEVAALLGQLNTRHLRHLTLNRVDAYPTVYQEGTRPVFGRFSPPTREGCLSRVEVLELKGFDIDDEASKQERLDFAMELIHSFPNVRHLMLKECTPLEDFFIALTPSHQRRPMSHLKLLTILGSSSGSLFGMARTRGLFGLGIESLFLINVKLNGGREELPALQNQVRLLDYVYLQPGPRGQFNILAYPSHPPFAEVRRANIDKASSHRRR